MLLFLLPLPKSIFAMRSFAESRSPFTHFYGRSFADKVMLLFLGGSVRYLDRMQPLALVVLRAVLGAVMIGHGSHKVYGHLQEFTGFIGSLGIPAWLGYVSAFTEFAGGILLLLGLFTRIVAFAMLIDMAVAIAKVHWKHGFMGAGGYEFPLALLAIAFALIFFGAGPISIDGIRRGGGAPRSSKA